MTITYNSETDQLLVKKSNGEWAVFKASVLNKLWLFDKGLTFVETTGGWGSNVCQYGSAAIDNQLHVYSAENNGRYQGTLVTMAKIDLTNYSKIKCVGTTNLQGNVCLCGDRTVGQLNRILGITAGTSEADISEYKGEYYIGVTCMNAVGWTSVSQIWLEP